MSGDDTPYRVTSRYAMRLASLHRGALRRGGWLAVGVRCAGVVGWRGGVGWGVGYGDAIVVMLFYWGACVGLTG